MLKKILILCEDTFFRGSFCGIIAGIIKDIISKGFSYFELLPFPFWAFSTGIAFTDRAFPFTFVKSLVGLILELIFSGLLGLVFAIIAKNIKTKHYIYLGAFYGSIIWFTVKAAILGFNISLLKDKDIVSPIILWALSILYGIILALLERNLSPKANDTST